MDLDRLPTLGAFDAVARDGRTFVGRITAEIPQAADMQQDISRFGQGRIVRDDETVALDGVEPLHAPSDANGLRRFRLSKVRHLKTPARASSGLVLYLTPFREILKSGKCASMQKLAFGRVQTRIAGAGE